MKEFIKKILRVKSVLCVTLVTVSLGAMAQDTTVHVVQDLESWTSARFQYKFNKKLKVRISENLRLEHNSSQLNQLFTEGSIEYKLLKPISLEVESRYGFKKKNSGNERFFRMFYAANYATDFDRFEVKGRLAFQKKNILPTAGFSTVESNTHLRYRVGLGYNIKGWKMDPFLSYELFRETGVDNPIFNKYRLKLSTNYSLKKAGKVAGFVTFERELQEEYPLNATIIGLNYTFSMKPKKKAE